MANIRGPKDAWARTATSLEAIVQQIDDNDIDASPEGRAFLAGAAAGFRTAAEVLEDAA